MNIKAKRTHRRKRTTKAAGRARTARDTSLPASAKRPNLVVQLGWMRWSLIVLALIIMVAAPKAGTIPVYVTWRMVPTLIIPVLTPLIFTLLLMDSLMSRIWMTDKSGEARRHYRLAIVLNLALAAGIAIAWYPYFNALGNQ